MSLHRLTLATMVALALCACSSSSDSKLSSGAGGSSGSGSKTTGASTGAGKCDTSDAVFTAPSGACATCAKTSCNSELTSAVGSAWATGDVSGGACGSYVTCFDKCCSDQACEVKCPASTSACDSALNAISQCEAAHCASSCGTSSTGGVNVNVNCFNSSQNACTQKMVSGGGAKSFEQGCTDAGGKIVDTCPTNNLTGCCQGATRLDCFYNADASKEQSTCKQQGGTWSSKLP